MRHVFYLFSLLFIGRTAVAQDPLRFDDEVTKLVAGDSAVNNKNLLLFTGSSSIRLWRPDLVSSFPGKNVLNRGFGGSQMTDLLYYFDKLILPYHARQIFVYEGDNDIASGKTPEEVIRSTDSLLQLIRSKVSRKVNVVFISAKPSLKRWEQRADFVKFNALLEEWAKRKRNVTYADVWTPMLDRNKTVRADLFTEDGLHMNATGYTIWTAVLSKYMR